ncbi:glycoside hydrolase family 36 protein [Haliangium ochraceum]|uniref:Alpha-galactosidase-like protein n=1 Tax=Haliangium ochraceum (strain DSM 14365 / JCM 11303 / SMP-2) TaxID=502025 RepID=D0LFT1_HALO1|nr:glycoside hydrolase family 36 protein [Haliangium ochraceum]ACY14533.1 Alpha-galactosidase-like protein [Haliangium ochraceum DSM 14365]
MSVAVDWDAGQRVFVLTGAFAQPVRFSSSFCVTQQGQRQRGRTIDAAMGTPSRTRGRGRDAWTFEQRGVRLTLAWEAPAKNALLLHSRLENTGRAPVLLQQITPARFDHSLPHFDDLEATRVYREGFQSWSPAGSVAATSVQEYPLLPLIAPMHHHIDAPDWGRDDGLLSFLFTLLQTGDERATLLGFLGQRVGLGTLFLQNRGTSTLTATLDYGGKRLWPGQSVTGEPLALYRGQPGTIVERYVKAVAASMDARPPARSPSGWCSFYELRGKVAAEDIRENARVLAAHPEFAAEFVQLDDGYQSAVGDWLRPNRKFPGGLAQVARDIRARGFRPGIWLAPFFAAKRSRLLREHPGWFLRDPRDRPLHVATHVAWKTPLYGLDLSHPAVEAWLGDLFGRLAACGFDYFKADFLFAGVRTGTRFDPALSPVECYRRGLAAIQAAIGPERYLLASGAPIGPSIGLVDGMRVSADNKEVWHEPLVAALARGAGAPSAHDCLRNTLTRSFMHGAWWRNDPDCLLVRDHDTDLTLDEVRLLVTVQGMSGGALFLSDDLANVDLGRLHLAAAVLPPTPMQAALADPMARDFPENFELRGPHSRVLALVNATSNRRITDTDIHDEHVFDFWAEQMVLTPPCIAPAHGVSALQITPRGEVPALVGTDLHLTALADGRIRSRYDAAERVLIINAEPLARRHGALWLALPEGYEAHPSDPRIKRVSTWEQGLVLEVKTHEGPSGLELAGSEPRQAANQTGARAQRAGWTLRIPCTAPSERPADPGSRSGTVL